MSELSRLRRYGAIHSHQISISSSPASIVSRRSSPLLALFNCLTQAYLAGAVSHTKRGNSQQAYLATPKLNKKFPMVGDVMGSVWICSACVAMWAMQRRINDSFASGGTWPQRLSCKTNSSSCSCLSGSHEPSCAKDLRNVNSMYILRMCNHVQPLSCIHSSHSCLDYRMIDT